ncbi:hypothetical protein PIB30_098695 [Stylosanthes scabra]|uniref:Uncharacterized protein n=1 Tax=Stylosanthes scabra TaxID=79078 RepID=A0ABU6YVZ1_9FABA|nr:hypothetical protein [Stylosanthes scabra]
MMRTNFPHTGVLTDPAAPSSFGAWLQYVGKDHVGAISFLIADFLLLYGVFALTFGQASQKEEEKKKKIEYVLFAVDARVKISAASQRREQVEQNKKNDRNGWSPQERWNERRSENVG